MSLILTDELAQALIGALYTICRADGEVTEAELDALHAVAAELGAAIDDQTLFFTDVTPASLADAIREAAEGGPFRAAAASPIAAIRAGFLAAADRIARVDGDYAAATRVIAQYDRELAALV